ncbi:MAG: hypothetical protein KJZ86_16190 [Caldilineaceae bacterium]|nr:hypothetical protein [Caldilineaceae bacterium]HRJ43056.1 hypothetical protein [Caldilineaceae bacterium]
MNKKKERSAKMIITLALILALQLGVASLASAGVPGELPPPEVPTGFTWSG